MSMTYSHLLIPPADRSPEPADVVRFLERAIALGPFGDEPTLTLRDDREVETPDARVIVRPPSWPLAAAADALPRMGTLSCYSLEALGESSGRRPFLARIGTYTESGWEPWSEPYALAIAVRVRDHQVSTSNLHEESEDPRAPPFLGDAADPSLTVGLYSHPETLEVIEVPGAGCARFYIELMVLGRFLFPKVPASHLRIVDEGYLAAAESTFGVRFMEGCQWG
jgi:hypothetical protein